MAERLGTWRLIIVGLGSLTVLFAALAGLWLEPTERAWILVIGFSLLTASCVNASRRFVIPALLGVVLVVFCGLSATVSVPEPIEAANERAATLDEEDLEAATPAVGIDNQVSDEGFRYAGMVTGLGGLSAMLTAIITASLMGASETRNRRRPFQIERIGKVLVAIGFVGVAGAMLRFLFTQLPIVDLWASMKSFWIGGTFLLLIATFAVPGFALWVQGIAGRNGSRNEYLPPALWSILYLALLVPTGQRGFLIALGVMLLAVLLAQKVIGIRALSALVLLGVLFVGLTQAARNEASGTNRITIGGFVERIQPDQWRELYSSQIASFNWTSLIEQNRSQLDIPNSFVELLAKPIPRSIYPEKSQGFGTEFTQIAFPGAAEQDVSFATPLVAETDYNFGPAGVILIFALLGFGVVAVDRRIAGRAPPLVEPVVVATVFWVAFELVRGDLANAIVFSAGWFIPLVIFSRGLGIRRRPRIKKVLVDALQVAPKFSGIGRRVEEIGTGFKRDPLPVRLEVWCPRDVRDHLVGMFPEGTLFRSPIKSSRPKVTRILFQNLVGPLITRASTLAFCPGDQAPVWGRAPLLLALHDVRRLAAPETARGSLEANFYKTVMRTGAKRADQIITISDFSKSEIDRYLDSDCPISVVSEQPTGIPVASADSLEENVPVFLVVGALRRYKGLETVVKALGELTDVPEVSAVSIGDAEGESEYVQEIVELARELGVESRFSTLGWVSDDELKARYGSSIGTINPSHYEGYGLAIAESLAAGLPTVSSDIPPHREIAGEAARYFEPGDFGQLASILRELASKPDLRRELSQLAQERHATLVAANRVWTSAITEALKDIDESVEPRTAV